jgi:hypothetical protein
VLTFTDDVEWTRIMLTFSDVVIYIEISGHVSC